MIYDKASLVQIPSGYKASSAKLYSVIPSSGDGDFTVSSATTGTRVNAEGLIEDTATDQARLSRNFIDGELQPDPFLLLEPTRDNLQVRSEEFDNTAWTKSNCTVSANQTTSPDGATTADKIIENSGSGSKKVYDGITTSSGTVYTWSVFLKADTRSKARLNIFGSYAEFDVANQTLLTQSGSTSYKIEEYGDGWGRFSITETANATSTLTYVYLLDDAGNVSYTGDGVSGLFVFGGQMEAGTYPTSYIPTTSAAVTRTVDTCENAGDDDLFNDTEGVLYAEIKGLADDDTFRFITLSDGTSNNTVRIYLYNAIYGRVLVGGVEQCVFSTTSYNVTDYNKIAILYSVNNFKMYVNGSQVGTTDTSGSTFPQGTLDELSFHRGDSQFKFYGNCKNLQVFNEALSDSELQALTS